MTYLYVYIEITLNIYLKKKIAPLHEYAHAYIR